MMANLDKGGKEEIDVDKYLEEMDESEENKPAAKPERTARPDRKKEPVKPVAQSKPAEDYGSDSIDDFVDGDDDDIRLTDAINFTENKYAGSTQTKKPESKQAKKPDPKPVKKPKPQPSKKPEPVKKPDPKPA